MRSIFKNTFLVKFALLVALVTLIGFSVNVLESEAKTKANKETSGGVNPDIDPSDPSSVLYLDTAGNRAGIGDPNVPASESVRAGLGWHPRALSASGLPLDRYGLVDWAKLVREGKIKPRHSLDPNMEEMPPLPLDVLIIAKSDYVDDVIYPHEIHTWWLKCEVCHPKIFIPAKGENHMTMAEIAEGQWCGRCHGKVAFPLTDCTRCHTSPK
ncbi:MAG: cytochrome c3 family protein [Thermodesulfobacteriota bacterium]